MDIIDTMKSIRLINSLYYESRAYLSLLKTYFLPVNRALLAYKNKYRGKRCFIVATGPSLTIEDLNKLKGEICFSMNSIIKSFDKTDWRPNFYGITDDIPFNMLKNKIDVNEFEAVFLASNAGTFNQKHISLNFTDYYRSKSLSKGSFEKRVYPSDKFEKYYINATSVTFMLIQLAYFMGFKKIYLLGQDCNFVGENLHTKIANINYKKKPAEVEGQYLIQIFENYKQWFQARGVQLFNATRGGKLEVLPRVNLDDIV